MIRFPCTCRQYQFEVDDDSAGRQVQCPRCGRLNDVPTLSDLASISDDGTYKLEATIDRHEAEQERLSQLQRAFARTRVDEWGREIDLRPTMQDVLAANSTADAPDSVRSARPVPPKYDPITGELIRPMDLDNDPRATQPPVPLARPTIHYAGTITADGLSVSGVFLQLFTAPNVTVMMFVFITHLLIQGMSLSALIGMLLVVPIALAVLGALVAHYSNVIDETGPEQRDELPRPMRGLNWHDDLWGSFVDFTTALTVSYGPGFLALGTALPPLAQVAIFGTGMVFGTIIFPAALLTSTTSGTWMNLRPDRMLGVIRAIGPLYVPIVILWIVAAATYVAGFIATSMTILSFLGADFGPMSILSYWAISYPLLLIGVYLMHAFCWILGIQYRRHHEAFPWVLQRHTRAPKSPPPAGTGRHGFAVLPQQPKQPAPVAAAPVAPRAAKPVPALPADVPDEELDRIRVEQRRARMLQQNRDMNLVRPPQSVLPMDGEDLEPPRKQEGRGFPLD